MSSALLYVAIVAIWAVFLVPAWLRKPHGHRDQDADPAADSAAPANSSAAPDSTPAGDTARPGEAPAAAAHDRYLAFGSPAGSRSGPPARGSRPIDHLDADSDDPRPSQRASAQAAAWPEDSEARHRMLRARRLILLILIVLTAVPVSAACAGIIGWWLCIPPSGMLALYLLLLREVAIADSEVAQARLYERQAQAARQSAASVARAAEPSEPTATIIDISHRVTDQLYDQYADTAARAVGD